MALKRNDRVLLCFVAVVLLLGLSIAGILLLEGRGGRTDPGGGPAAAEGAAGGRTGADEVPPDPEPGGDEFPIGAGVVEVRLRLRTDPYALPRGSRSSEEETTAALEGRVTGPAGSPAPRSRLRFVAGLNRDAEAAADEEGWYAFAGLLPGRGILRIEAPGHLPILREVVVPIRGTARHDVHFAGPIDLAGRVIDRDGKGIAGAEVRIDERVEFADAEGVFRMAQVTPGDLLVHARAEGHAPRRETIALRAEAHVAPADLTILLERAAVLHGEVHGAPIGSGTASIALVPDKPPTDRSFPYDEFDAIPISGNGAFRVEGVPIRKPCLARPLHPLAAARPPERFVFLTGEGDQNLSPAIFRLHPVRAVEGTVLDGETGQPLARARVALEANDLVSAARSIHPAAGPALDAYVVDPPAVLRSETMADGGGRFLAGTGPYPGPWRLEVTAPGYRTLERLVPRGSGDVPDLILFREDTLAAGARLEIVFDPPPAGEVAVTLDGSARPAAPLGDAGPLVLAPLVPGRYELEVRSGSRTIHEQASLLVGGRTRVEVRLP